MKKIILLIILGNMMNCISYSANARQMEVTTYGFVNPIGENICVGSGVGSSLDTEKFQPSFIYIDDDNLKQSVSDSIANARGFEKFQKINCNWTIDVIIKKLEKQWGFYLYDAEVKIQIEYQVLFKGFPKKIMEIDSTGEVKFLQARFGTERAGKAMELSVQNNIHKFLMQMSKLRFNPDGTIIDVENDKNNN